MMDFICPYTCSYRTSRGYCGSTGGWERCQYRQLHQPNTVVGYVPPLQKTNADRIRAMTDEELALFIHNAEAQAIDTEIASTVKGWLDWLKEEAQCTSE